MARMIASRRVIPGCRDLFNAIRRFAWRLSPKHMCSRTCFGELRSELRRSLSHSRAKYATIMTIAATLMRLSAVLAGTKTSNNEVERAPR
jgi:hypothetical protein